MTVDYKQYPKDWKAIRQRILERAGHCCENCRVPNHVWIMRDLNGDWCDSEDAMDQMNYMPYDEFCKIWGDKQVPIKIVLTISHQDHDITNNTDENLKALCQRCHLSYDAQHHAESRRRNRDARVGQGKLMDIDV